MPDIIAQATEIIAPKSTSTDPQVAAAPAGSGFIDPEKTILSDGGKWFISRERAAKYIGYSDPDNVHVKARRQNWKWQELQVRGGLKKFYAVESLPAAAQINFYKDLGVHLAPQEDESPTNRYQRASEVMRRRAQRRLDSLKAWRAYRRGTPRKNKSKADKDFVSFWNTTHPEERISRATLHRFDDAEKQDGISGLVDDYPRKSNNQALFSEEARAYLESLFLDESRRDIRSCYQNMRFMAKLNGWTIPSYTTCRRHLLKLSRDVVTYLREGSKAFHDKAYPSVQRDPSSIEIGQVYVADDRLADISFGQGKAGDRVWVTVWMDMRSRKVMSVIFTSKGNNTQAVLDGFYQATQEHIANEVYFDNGGNYREAGYVTKDQEATMPPHLQAPFKQLLGADKIHWALPGNARAKVVERAFLEMARINDKNSPGYTGMNVLKRPEGWYLERAEGNFLSAEEIVKNIRYYFFEIWNNWGPDGRKSPNEIWVEYFSKHARRRVDPEYLRNLLLRTHPKPIKLRANGIQFGKMCNGAHSETRCHCKPRFYWDESLQLLTGGTREVWVKFSDFEPEHIWIYRKDGTPIGEVPIYAYNKVPALRAGKQIGEYQGGKKRRVNEIKALSDRIKDIHQLNLENPEALMQRADVKASPEPAINIETGEVIEMVEAFVPAHPAPDPIANIEVIRKRSHKIKETFDHVEDILSTLPDQIATDPGNAWDHLDGII